MENHLFIIGPGGAGKSTVGPLLATISGYKFIDLDDEFCARIDNIRAYILKNGYESYLENNSVLCRKLIAGNSNNKIIMVLSSGFLATDIRPDIVNDNRKLVADNGKSILLLPSDNFAISKECIVARQLRRGYGLEREKESQKISQRFYEYMAMGDYKIFSMEDPIIIASKIAALLAR